MVVAELTRKIILQGDIAQTGMTSILSLIKLSQKSGTLRLKDGEKNASIRIEKNYFIEASAPEEILLGEFLVREGYLTEQDLAKTLPLQKRMHIPLGQLLQGMGYFGLDANALTRILNRYLREVIFRIMKWNRGTFTVEETVKKDFPVREEIPVRLNMDFVLLDTTQRLDEWKRLASSVTSLQSALKINRRAISENASLTLNADQLTVLSYVNGRRTLVRILEKIGHNEMFYLSVIDDLLKRRILIERQAEAMRVIIPGRIKADAVNRNRQFPGKFAANLLYKEIDGKKNLHELADSLHFELPDLWENISLLLKNEAVEIIEGRREFHNLSEEM
ncbi:MAG TPA: DUF4388 domain-containing protein [bacterium]|nr:DUF4388 domain-containing protein [bacterium]